MTDAFGRELHVGDEVVYASRVGSSVWLRTLHVVQAESGFILATQGANSDGWTADASKPRKYTVRGLLAKLERTTK